MKPIKAIGFDLFNTLITIDPKAMKVAFDRLLTGLNEEGLCPEREAFKQSYREAALRFMTKAKKEGNETHNRFWISAALLSLGIEIAPEDERIARAVENYFSAFYDYCRLIPGTKEMLGKLRGSYRIGLLSNFTHAPAAIRLLELTELFPFFDIVLVSGAIGYRKPHPLVFEMLVEKLGVEKECILYVGDDLEPDIWGADRCGLQPVWMTYASDKGLSILSGGGQGDDINPSPSVPRIAGWDDLFDLLK